MKISIGFSGDIAFSEHTKELYKNPKALDNNIHNFFNSNDYNILNFESPVTKSTITKKSALAHKSDPNALPFIKNEIKNPILSLANNHMMDFGPKGLLDSIEYIKQQELSIIGAGENEEKATDYIILGKEVKIGIISAQYKDYLIATKDLPGTAQDKHFPIIKEKIKELKNKVDWVVMIYHGGEEFINTPLPNTRKQYKKFLSWGADIVVAHHPHTVQGYEKINNKTIFYSLGNFIFDTDFQRAQTGTDEGMLIKINFTKDNYTYETLSIHRDREKGIIKKDKDNIYFKEISKTYHKDWKSEARRLTDIKQRKKDLKKYRNMFSISNLYIENAEYNNLISFDKLIDKYYISELEEPPVFKTSNRIVRKFKRLYRKFAKANYKKFFYTHYARIFK